MRIATFMGLVLIAKAIDPNIIQGNIYTGACILIVFLSGMDIVEFFIKLFKS